MYNYQEGKTFCTSMVQHLEGVSSVSTVQFDVNMHHSSYTDSMHCYIFILYIYRYNLGKK